MVADAKAVRLFSPPATAPGLHGSHCAIFETMDAGTVILRSIASGSRPEVLHENSSNQGVSGHRVHGRRAPGGQEALSHAVDPPSSSSSRAAFSQTAELSALVEEPLFEVDHGIVAAPGHPVLAPDADLKTVFAQSEWLTTVQDEGFLLEKLGGLGISPERVTLCDFFGIDALKGRNDALTLSPLSVIEDSLYAGRPRRTSPCALSAFSPHRLLLSPKGG